jgi:hypothetical protein
VYERYKNQYRNNDAASFAFGKRIRKKIKDSKTYEAADLEKNKNKLGNIKYSRYLN